MTNWSRLANTYILTKQRHHFTNKGPYSQSYGFSSSHVCMWELDYKESWVPKNWCFWTVVLEMTLESPLDCKDIKSVNPKGKQSWIFIGRTGAETPMLWPSDVKNWLFEKDPDAGKSLRQEDKGTTEDEMVGWHHQLDEYEFKQAPEVGDGQGSLACCNPWGYKESDMTEWLNWTEPLSRVQLFCNPLDCSPPGSSVHEISQVKILECVAIPSPGDLPDPRTKRVSPAGRFFTTEPPGKPSQVKWMCANACIVWT